MINAVTNWAVRHLTINMASSFGAGNYGMSGRAYDPRLMFAWPSAKLAVMGEFESDDFVGQFRQCLRNIVAVRADRLQVRRDSPACR